MSARAGAPFKRVGLAILLRPERVEAALWRDHAVRAGAKTRQRLFDHYRTFARRLAQSQFRKRKEGNFDLGDIEQLAYEALIQSVDRFEPYKSVPFEAFARMRINGHIANGLAQTSEAAAQYRYRQRAERDRLRSLHNPADALADPIAALSSLSAAIAIGLMLEADFSSAVEAIPDPAPSAYDSLAWNELHGQVHQLIDALPDQEAYVVQQHYRNDVSFQQIAVLMGLSNGRVSQIHRAALQRLRGRLAKLR
ncbi:MAG: sigma-70 family RNA polymerase sigma factor [Proteobacteria bacterium]|nr:MAG: sigma-70 family RNA polymerase sigma factor [Pseudomonadota bacterium]